MKMRASLIIRECLFNEAEVSCCHRLGETFMKRPIQLLSSRIKPREAFLFSNIKDMSQRSSMFAFVICLNILKYFDC